MKTLFISAGHSSTDSTVVGEYSDEEDDPPLLHNHGATAFLGLSLTPQDVSEG